MRESLESLALSGEALDFLLRRSPRRRTLGVRVSEAGEVVVNAPLRLPLTAIHHFLHQHAEWLALRRQEARDRIFHWRAGASLPYRGQVLSLVVTPRPGKPQVWLEGESLVCTALPDQVEAAVLRWYHGRARVQLAQRLAHWAQVAGRVPPPLRLSNARTRWGSLSAKGLVSLNWRLIKAPPLELDYVVCHELAHFRQRNHSAAFWREVAALFPAWETARRGLRENGRVYFQF